MSTENKKIVTSMQKELFNLRMQGNVDGERRNMPKNGIRFIRRKIARMKTVLNEKRKS